MEVQNVLLFEYCQTPMKHEELNFTCVVRVKGDSDSRKEMLSYIRISVRRCREIGSVILGVTDIKSNILHFR